MKKSTGSKGMVRKAKKEAKKKPEKLVTEKKVGVRRPKEMKAEIQTTG